MIAVDTSVVVAGHGPWHEAFDIADPVLRRRPRLASQVVLETFSVLTRMPPPFRATPRSAAAYVESLLAEPPLGLPAGEYAKIVAEAAAHGLAGKLIYDAAVGLAARRAGAKLVTRDRRALPVYEMVGAPFDLIGDGA